MHSFRPTRGKVGTTKRVQLQAKKKLAKTKQFHSTTTTESSNDLSTPKNSTISPTSVDLSSIEQFKQNFLQEEMQILKSETRRSIFDAPSSSSLTATDSTNNAVAKTKKSTELPSTEFTSVSHLVTSTSQLTRKQTRDLLELGSSSIIVEELLNKVPKQYSTCRGCGIGLQCKSEEQPGFIPSYNLQSYLIRLDIQLRAAKQDLRIRSGGGKGQGTAVAALHASLKSSLAQVQRENEAKKGKFGRFTDEKLEAMGIDHNLQPLDDQAIVNPETGEIRFLPRPEDTELLVSTEHIPRKIKEMKKRLNLMINDPTASAPSINSLQQQIQEMELKKVDVVAESAKIDKKQILDKRDIDMLEKAAKLASKPAKCQRCHRIGSKQYHLADLNRQQTITSEDFIHLLKREFQNEEAKSSIIIKVIDVLDFHGSMIQDLQKLTGPRNPIILAINKCDVLPREVNAMQVKIWAKSEAEKYGLNVHSIFPISASTGTGVDDLLNKALILARGNNDPTAPKNRNIYVMGTTNVGKSSLINQLLQKGLVGTGMPNDVTSIARKSKHDNVHNNKFGKKKFENENGGEIYNAHMDGLMNGDDGNEFLDTHALDDEMADEMVLTKRTERAMKKALKEAKSPGTNGPSSHDILMSKRHDSSHPDINPVIAEIDVAGVARQTLDAILPDKYLLDHQREIQLQEASSTTSPIPGTTLGIVSFPILEKKRGGRNLQIKDTPGVLNAWQLTSHLNLTELKRVLPTKRMTPLTYRVQPGQSVMLGALARIDMITGKPYQITNFVSSAVSVHIAASHRVDKDYLQQQIGVNLIPPFDPDINSRPEDLNIFRNLANVSQEESDALSALQHLSRLEGSLAKDRSRQTIQDNTSKQDFEGGNAERFGDENVIDNIKDPKRGIDELAHRRKELRDQVSVALGQLAPVVSATTQAPSRVFIDQNGRFVVQLVGQGFKEASHDVVIAGLGWITVTGVGPLTLRISLAGTEAQLTQFDLDQIAVYYRERGDTDEIFAETNIDSESMSIKNKLKNRIPTHVRQLLSRIVVRDPLFTNTAYTGDKWTGVPELVKKRFTPQMSEQRARIMKRNELINLHRQDPGIHSHPDEIQHQIDNDHPFASATDNYKNYTMNDLMSSNTLIHSTRLHELSKFEQELANEAAGTPRQNTIEALKAQKKAKMKAKRDMAALYGTGELDPNDSSFEDDDMIEYGSDFDEIGTYDELTASGQRPKGDILTGEFDAIPHPPVKYHSTAEEEAFKAKLENKLKEKQLNDDWEFIQQFHAKNAQSTRTDGKTAQDGTPHMTNEEMEGNMKKQRQALAKLKTDIAAKSSTKKQRQLLEDAQFDAILDELAHDDDFDENADQFDEFDAENYKEGNFEITEGEIDDDEELITDINSIYANLTDSDDVDQKAQKGKKLSKKNKIPDYHSDHDVDDKFLEDFDSNQDESAFEDINTDDLQDEEAFAAGTSQRSKRINANGEEYSVRRLKQAIDYDDNHSDIYEGDTSDVEYLDDFEQMASLEEMANLSDFDGVDYNLLRQEGRFDEFLAKENEKIDKRPVPTGPEGKRETGGRRAREAMGLVKENKFAELKRIQLQKEAKELHSMLRKAGRQERLVEKWEESKMVRDTTSTKGNRGIVPKGSPNHESSGLMRTNQSYRFEEQNEAKRQKTLTQEIKATRYGPQSDSEDDPRKYRRMVNDVSENEDEAIPISIRPKPQQRPPRQEAGDRPPRRDFGGDRPPRRDFDGDHPPRRDFAGNDRKPSGDRPPRRDFGGDRPPRRDFGGDRPPRRDFGGDHSPRRDFGGDRPPRRDFGGDRPPRRDFGGDRPPRPDSGGDRPPRRDFGGDRPPRRDFGGDRPPRRDFGGDRPPRRDFGGDRPPRRDFNNDRQGGSDRPPRRDFNNDRQGVSDRPPRRDFNNDRQGGSDRPPRRDFNSDRPPRRDFNDDCQQSGGNRGFGGDRPPRRDFNNNRGGRAFHTNALTNYLQNDPSGSKM